MDIADVVKASFVPGSMFFLLLGLTVGVGLLLAGPRTRRWGIAWLTVLTLGYWVLALPPVASGLEAMLADGYRPLESAAEARGADTIIVLGGGSQTFRAGASEVSVPGETTALRALEAARLYALLGGARVIASGGPGGEAGEGAAESSVIRSVLEANGVPGERITDESLSSDTHQEAIELAILLGKGGSAPVILVTSPTHMRRALGALAAQGIVAIPSPARMHGEGTHQAGSAFLPREQALQDSRSALREVMGLIYYRLRGWLAPAG